MLAGIRELPPTLQDRSLVIKMERALPGEVKKHLEDGYASGLADIGRKFSRWAQGIEVLPAIDLSEGAGLHNRLGDNWRPLLAIAELALAAPGLRAPSRLPRLPLTLLQTSSGS